MLGKNYVFLTILITTSGHSAMPLHGQSYVFVSDAILIGSDVLYFDTETTDLK